MQMTRQQWSCFRVQAETIKKSINSAKKFSILIEGGAAV